MTTAKFYELIENAAENVEHTAGLFEWSENYDFPSPASLFLDLIGYSEEELGEHLCRDKMPSLGYLEADYLGDALKEWAHRPNDVYAFVEKLMNNYTDEKESETE
jgi:hypothetical protein